jgi:hypothetical protein
VYVKRVEVMEVVDGIEVGVCFRNEEEEEGPVGEGQSKVNADISSVNLVCPVIVAA